MTVPAGLYLERMRLKPNKPMKLTVAFGARSLSA